MGRFVIGVDGGGTKTLGAIAGPDAVVLAQNEVGSTNYNVQPLDVVRANLRLLVDNLLHAVGGRAEEVGAICLGMSGCDRPEDKKTYGNLAAEVVPGAKCEAVNDAVIALVGGVGVPRGIIVISGTGSIAYGYDGLSKSARCGGWGNILGDEGSGYGLAFHSLRAIMRAHDGRGEPTALRDAILGRLHLERPEQLLGWLREVKWGKAEIAALSREVLETAAAGDPVARRIMEQEADDLAHQAQAVAAKLFPGQTDFSVVVGGGNLRKSRVYFDCFTAAVARRLPGVPVILPEREPVEGAVIYAAGMAG